MNQDNENYQYYAFISYKREDEKVAKWLQKRLERYSLPISIRKKRPELPKKLFPNFLDKTDIMPNPLEQEIYSKLDSSKFLIVICSPRSAKSYWVGREINHFIESGKAQNIILFNIEGEPYSGELDTENIHQVVKDKMAEMLPVNIAESGKGLKCVKREMAIIRIISRLFGVSFDTLWRRQRRRMIRRVVVNAILVLIAIAASLFVWFYTQPFDMRVSLNEITPHNSNLPFLGAKVELVLDDEVKSIEISDLGDPIEFVDVASKYENDEVKVTFSSYGYAALDTVISAYELQTLNITRDSTYSKIRGVVRSDKSDELMSGVVVRLNGVEAMSDKSGCFEIVLPIEKQEEIYSATLEYEGKKTEIKDRIYPTKGNNDKVNTIYL